MFFCERCKTGDPDRCVCRKRQRLQSEAAALDAEIESIRDDMVKLRERVTNLDAFADGRLSLAVDAVQGALTCAISTLYRPNWDRS